MSAVLWPERESLYDLMRLRATIGVAAFNSEKQNDPLDPTLCEWPAEYFDWPGFWFDRWPDRLAIRTLALDPSKGKDARHGDYSAYVRLGRDERQVMYVEADLQRRTSEAIVDAGVEHCRQFRPNGFVVETNVFAELFVVAFRQASERLGVPLPLYTMDNTVNKQVRIRRLGPYLAQRQMRFKARSPGTALLVQQARDFPLGDFDDGIDALELGLRLMIELHNGRLRSKQQGRLRS
jgi:predicted phage terminase large subunit-like protein